MRRNLVAGTAGLGGLAALQLQPQVAQLPFEFGDSLLLARDGAVQFFEQVFVEAQLDFDFGHARFHDGYACAFASTTTLTPWHSTVCPARIFAVLRLSGRPSTVTAPSA